MTGNEAVRAVIDALDGAEIAYMVVGSYSSNVYGVDRSTQHADFVVELEEAQFGELARRLRPAIRLDPQKSFEGVTTTHRYIAQVVGTQFRIEFFLLSDDPHDRERFARRRRLDFLGGDAHVASPEDVIITKLRWSLQAGRPKDREDVRNVIAVQEAEGRLDWDYIRHWCGLHGTLELLEEVRRSIPPIDEIAPDAPPC